MAHNVKYGHKFFWLNRIVNEANKFFIYNVI